MSNVISKSIRVLKNWWLFLVLGILLILASFNIMSTPKDSYIGLAWMFSILVLINGIFYVFFSISNREQLEGWGWYLAGGIFEVIVGIALVSYPEISILMLPVFLGFWLMFRASQIIGFAFDLRSYGFMDWGWYLLFGVLIFIMAFMMVVNPLFGYVNVVILTAAVVFIYGLTNVLLSFKLKKIKSKTIDKVEKFKKDVKKDLKDLKKEVMAVMKEMSEEQQKELDQAFENYQKDS